MSERGQELPEVRGLMATMRTRWQRLTGSLFGRDIALVLALKVALIVALYLFLFRTALRPAQDPVATAAAVAGAQTVTEHEVQR